MADHQRTPILGSRLEDRNLRSPYPFDPALTAVGKFVEGGHTYVLLRHDGSGEHFARPLHSNMPTLHRVVFVCPYSTGLRSHRPQW